MGLYIEYSSYSPPSGPIIMILLGSLFKELNALKTGVASAAAKKANLELATWIDDKEKSTTGNIRT